MPEIDLGLHDGISIYYQVAGEIEIEDCFRAVLYRRDIEAEWAEGSTVIEAFNRLVEKCINNPKE